jgi:hypothetical protein
MTSSPAVSLPPELAADLVAKFFWWTHVGEEPRSDLRILAQAMSLASFAEVRQLETMLGREPLVEAMLQAEPGWIDDRSWEFWRGRLALATGRAIPEEPPRRIFDAGEV